MVNELLNGYEETVGTDHKKKHGQFFTHPSVADFMVGWVLKSEFKSVFDPAFGLGAFFEAASRLGADSFYATEIDKKIIEFWKSTNGVGKKVSIKNEDYLYSWEDRNANIVCNPPYLRFQKFFGREEVRAHIEEKLGLRISGYTNIASVFLLKSLSELKYGARMAYILPPEFLNTGYGEVIKEKLLRSGWLQSILSINCEKDVFPDATTSVCILLIDTKNENNYVDFYSVNSIEFLDEIFLHPPVNRVAASDLSPKDKWQVYFSERNLSYNKDSLVPLSFYGRFSRGIATGANEFFLLSKNRIGELGLKLSEVVGCISKSSQIKNSFFDDRDFQNLESEDHQVYLLNLNGNLSLRGKEYVKYGESQNYHTRFLTKNRDPWYKIEQRQPSPLLFGVFSRDGYKVIRNTTKALNLTCFHGFQPNMFGTSNIDHLFLYLKSKIGREILSINMRKYGDALDKFEPNDLNNAMVPNPQVFSSIDQNIIKEEIEQVKLCGKISNEFEDILASKIK